MGPPAAIAHAILVGSDVEHIGAFGLDSMGVIAGLLVADYDQAVAGWHRRECSRQGRAAVRLAVDNGIPQSKSTARPNFDQPLAESENPDGLAYFASDHRQSAGGIDPLHVR